MLKHITLEIAMRKNLTEIITIFQSVAIQPKVTLQENHQSQQQATNHLPTGHGNHSTNLTGHQPTTTTHEQLPVQTVEAVIHGYQSNGTQHLKPMEQPRPSTRVNFRYETFLLK